MYLEIFLFFLAIIYLVKRTVSKRERLPPGESGWPVLGYIPPSNEGVFEVVQKMTEKFGKIITWKLGTWKVIFIGDFKALKESFSAIESTGKPSIFRLNMLTNGKKLGFFSNDGQSANNLRRFTLAHLKNAGMGKSSMENRVLYELECLIEEFRKDVGQSVEIPWSLNVAVINSLWKIIADVRSDVSDKKAQEFQRLVANVFIEVQNPLMFIFDQYPILPKLIPRFIQAKLGLAPLFAIMGQLTAFIKKAIDDHKSSLDEENPRNFIDAFLIQIKATKNGRKTEKNFNFTDEELLFCLIDLYVAGGETTSSTFRWIILYMMKYPEVQRKVQEEIDQSLPRDRLPSLSDKDKLVYTQAVINEVLRLNPIALFGFYHTFHKDFKINGYSIPKEALVKPSIIMCHFDPDYWEDPKAFKPERFITADGKLDINKEGFLPFSIGRRSCVGESLARMVLFFFVVGILQTFKFEAPEGVELNTEPDRNRPLFLIPKPFKTIMTIRD